MDQLPVEIASTVLKFLNFNELTNICDNSKLPSNFERAIRDKRVWKQKLLTIRNLGDVRKCIKNMNNVRNCTMVSFSSSNIGTNEILMLIKGMDSIEKLSLDNCFNLDDESMEVIFEKHGKSLKHLSLKGCQYLTNFSLAQLARYCDNLVSLNISECSFSSGGLELIADNDKLVASLKYFDVSKCYLLDQGAIQPLSNLKSLKILSLRNLEWLSASNLPFIIYKMSEISKIDVRNCDDFTKQSVEQVKGSLNHPVEIIENTKLADESADSIRGYLMAMINSQIL